MISYEPFYLTLKEKGITTYKLITYYGISRSLIDRLKHNKPISTVTINDLCQILDCEVQNILCYKNESNT
ncbi:MAG: helix-turn-helix transcriptional regulator [Clostridiales bacterium]|nr:helix-turn-helix transcriptional regulator [Clostridiales bacterium]